MRLFHEPDEERRCGLAAGAGPGAAVCTRSTVMVLSRPITHIKLSTTRRRTVNRPSSASLGAGVRRARVARERANKQRHGRQSGGVRSVRATAEHWRPPPVAALHGVPAVGGAAARAWFRALPLPGPRYSIIRTFRSFLHSPLCRSIVDRCPSDDCPSRRHAARPAECPQ